MESTDPGLPTAAVVWRNPRAIDTVGRHLEAMCMPPSGSAFQMGITEVTCSATDDEEEELACTFNVTIIGT